MMKGFKTDLEVKVRFEPESLEKGEFYAVGTA
jgi:hypothetical protein